MSWGTLGASITLEGASSRSWTLRFERRLAPRENAATANQASSVWLVRDETSARLYAAKRQTLASITEVDALVDEAAAWRNACLADTAGHVVELVDVFVSRTPPFTVTFLADFCTRGLLPKRNLSEPVLLTLVADLSAAAEAMPSPHAHIAYDAVLVDDKGCVRLAGFGAHRSAILRDNPGLTANDDAFDIGMFLYELVFGSPPPEDLSIPDQSPYSEQLVSLISMAFSHPHPAQLREAAIKAGAEPRAPVVDVERPEEESPTAPTHVARAVDRNVDRLIDGIDIAPAFAALLADLQSTPEIVAPAVFKALFKKPMSKDPLCSVRALTMLHNLILDGPEPMLEAVRKNDKFMEWIESSWTREVVEEKGSNADEDTHPSTYCFAGGELAFYSAFLRRKARFHMLAAGGFSGRWDRLDVQGADGRNVLATRRRKVVSGMADLIEMASELGCLFASAGDEEAPAKHAGLGALVSECCLAFNGGLELAHEAQTAQVAEKLVPGIQRLYTAARALVFAVERVPSAGGEDWVQQFSGETPPDIVADVAMKERMGDGGDGEEFPREGWENAEVDEAAQKKAEKKKKKKKKKEEKKAAEAAKAAGGANPDDPTAADGALVVHGADDAASKVTTMFGDLLRIDDGAGAAPEAPQEAPRPPPDMTNAKALASAFGVAEEAVQTQYDDAPGGDEGGYDDEDGDDGGYENYQARQTAQVKRVQGQSTAAWAAQAGYGSRALVVSETANKKSHPPFCQCALCDQEEAEIAAQEQAAGTYSGGGPPPADNAGQDYGYGEAEVSSQQDYGKPAPPRDTYRDQYNDDADSLDDDGGAAPQAQQPPPPKNDYYQDDYDSYESVEYDVGSRDEAPSYPANAQAQRPTNNPFDGAVPDTGADGSYGAATGAYYEQEQYSANTRSVAPPFKLDAKQRMNMKKLRPGDKIADTEETQVSKGEYNRETVAIKKLTKKGMQSEKTVSNFKNEVEVMCALSHTNLQKCIAASIVKPNFVFATEFMKRGSIFEVLYKSRIKLTWALIKKVALQVAQAMAHMHERGYLHRDLKTLNIFADASYNVKVGDFGLSCHVSQAETREFLGTFQYMAPEVLRGDSHTEKSDVFAFGHVVCEMISASPPFPGMDVGQVRDSVNQGARPTIPAHCQRVYINLIQKCWGGVPKTRPSFAEIVSIINSAK